MSWQQLSLEIPSASLGETEALLELLGAASLTLADAAGDDIFEPAPGSNPVWPRTRVRALFPDGIDASEAARVLSSLLGSGVSAEVRTLSDSDWVDALLTTPRRLSIGARLAIASADDERASAERIVIRLNRGLGFGTGEHPTTRLCLDFLEATPTAGATVIDYGCGSGILAVTALCLGADRAWAVDIEPQALDAAVANAALNDVADRLWVGYPHQLPTLRADLVLANILSGTLIDLAPELAQLVRESGILVLTGIMSEQCPAVYAAYSALFRRLQTAELDGWVRLTATDPLY